MAVKSKTITVRGNSQNIYQDMSDKIEEFFNETSYQFLSIEYFQGSNFGGNVTALLIYDDGE